MDNDLIYAIASALEDIGRAPAVARGGQRNTGEFYRNLSNMEAEKRKLAVEEEKKRQEAVRQKVLDSYKASEEERAKAKFASESEEADPNSRASVVMRSVLQKNMPGVDLSGLSAQQMKMLPGATPRGANKRFANLTDEDGVVRSYIVDLDTGEKSPVGKAGFSQNTYEDPETGSRVVFNPALGVSRPMAGGARVAPATPAIPVAPATPAAPEGVPSAALLPGETPKQRDVRLGLETKQAEGKIKSEQERASEQRKETQKAKNIDLMEKDLMSLHQFSKMTGPIAGQAGQLARGLGFNPDSAAAAFEGQVQLWANEYIREISGAGVPVAEFEERFKPLLPSVTDSSSLAAQKFENFKKFVNRSYKSKYGAQDKSAAARKWLEANPNDPRAEAIRKKLEGN